jgi:sialate O-acetylesterase
MKKIFLLAAVLFYALFSIANITLPRIFGSNMVLQRNKPIPVWGWADPGEKVTVQFNKQVKKAKAGKDGSWKIELNQESAGGPYQLIAIGKNTITMENVLVGEVWICSGQSNMEWSVKNSDNAQREIRESDYPMIRHIQVPKTIAATPAKDITGGAWQKADSSTTANFTAVGYFFARKLFKELNVPIGLINASWGGTMVEAWTSKEAFENSEEFKNLFGTLTFADIQAAADKSGKAVSPNAYPTLLFNGMINPIIPFAIRGAIWYQGETNAGRAFQYRKAFPLMIQDWRSRFGQGNFPFYFVQLASFNASNGNSAKGSGWAELREAQTATLSLPNTGMAVTMDIGESNDIHPRNKQDVGARLAAIALNNLYGVKTEYSGPLYQSYKTEGDKIVLSFTHADNGLVIKDKYGYLKGFEIAGADKKFYYAKAEIKNNQVIVYSDSVSNPVAARYGWADDMPEVNLYNKQGFPASPFRTDTWKGVTDDAKYKIRK